MSNDCAASTSGSSWSFGPGWTISREMNALERARVEQQLLARTALLGRRAEDGHPQADVLGHCRQSH